MDKTLTDVQPVASLAISQPSAPEATCSVRLTERDEAAVLAAADDNPPTPNEAALQAAKRFIQRHG